MDKLTALLSKLADKLGTTVEHLWAVLVQQAHNQAYAYWAWLALTIVAAMVLFLLYKRGRQDDWDEGWLVYGLASVVYVVSIIMFISELPSFLACLNNPEYYALEKVLGVIGN